MNFFVYILYSKSRNRLYVGQTTDVNNRLIEHNTGESPYTSEGMPWTLVWSAQKSTLKEAMCLEEKLKNLSRERKIRLMRKYSDGIADLDLLNEMTRS